MVARVVAAAGAAAAAAAASLPPPAASLLALHLFEHGCGRLRTPCMYLVRSVFTIVIVY